MEINCNTVVSYLFVLQVSDYDPQPHRRVGLLSSIEILNIEQGILNTEI